MKILKWILIAIVAIALLIAATLFLMSEKEPQGHKGTEADELAQNMLTALNYGAFNDLRFVQWSFFMGKHHYRWDRFDNVAEILWDGNKVIMNLDTKEAQVFQNNGPITETTYKNALINEAWKYWCNDSFWMFAPFKVFDPGTERSIVETENSNTKGLKIHYESGGHTPGDSYVWEIKDDDNMPISWKMWTKILPVKGMETTWEKWIPLEGGALVSTFHSSSVIEMEMFNIKSGNSLQELNWSNETFNYKG